MKECQVFLRKDIQDRALADSNTLLLKEDIMYKPASFLLKHRIIQGVLEYSLNPLKETYPEHFGDHDHELHQWIALVQEIKQELFELRQ